MLISPLVAALHDREHRVLSYAQQLDKAISKRVGQPIDVILWCKLFTFDTMFDVTFGVRLNLLENEEPHVALDIQSKGTEVLGIMTPTPWLFHILFSVPGLQAQWRFFRDWAHEQLQRRLKVRLRSSKRKMRYHGTVMLIVSRNHLLNPT